jgi:ribonucleotide reductase beta subunit family protein with ferritin-like domain
MSSVPGKFKFTINHTKSLKKLQEVFAISNWKIYHTHPSKKYVGYNIKVLTTRNSHSTSATKKVKQNYSGKVYCLSVPSGAFFVRYNEKVSVGGNCHTRLTETIIKNWQAGEDKDFINIIKEEERLVYTMFDLAVATEIEWAEYLFKNGSILGLNVELLSQYIKFIANRRLKAINMKPLYDVSTKNPLSWVDNYLKSGALSVAPQESEFLSYQIGNIDKNITEGQFSNFQL